jgi:hypothetical protein
VGYSARYHVASLAAVFLALAAGILIGAEFGSDVLKNVTDDLEESLKGDLAEAEARIDELEAQLDREQQFSEAVYPSLVGDTLPGRSLAVVAFGGRPDDLRDDILDAIEPTGAEVTQLAVVREPPDSKALADVFGGDDAPSSDHAVESFVARRAGRALVEGDGFYDDVREPLLSTFSGDTDPVDGVVVVRDQPGLDNAEEEETDQFESDFIQGMQDAGVPVVAVQRTDASPSSVEYFADLGVTTVDDIDLTAGKVSMVYALRGAQGRFGIGDDAELVPPLLRRPGATTTAP